MPIDISIVDSTRFLRFYASEFKSSFMGDTSVSSDGSFEFNNKSEIDREPYDDGTKVKLRNIFIATAFYEGTNVEPLYKFEATYISDFEVLNKTFDTDEAAFHFYLLSLAWLKMSVHIQSSLNMAGFTGMDLPLSPPMRLIPEDK